jgi:hypothetical protein
VLDAGKLYVVDGVEIALWNLGDGVKTHSLQLVADDDAAKARAALLDLKKAIQSVEWATLLEQAEDEWIRLTTQQVATPPPSDERDRLDALAADYFAMLRAMRPHGKRSPICARRWLTNATLPRSGVFHVPSCAYTAWKKRSAASSPCRAMGSSTVVTSS